MKSAKRLMFVIDDSEASVRGAQGSVGEIHMKVLTPKLAKLIEK
jgi:hypothetical protein